MTRYRHIGWHVAAVVAFAGTAALGVILTRAPVGSHAALSVNVTCPSSGLQAWLGLGTTERSGASTGPGTGTSTGPGTGASTGPGTGASTGPGTGASTGPGTGTGTEGTGSEATERQTVGGTYYTLEFTNVSLRACSLYGYPEVSAYAGSQIAGGQIGSAAIRDTSVRPQPVTLAPGATAHSVLRVAGTGSMRRTACSEVTAEELRVTLPDQGRPAFVPAHIPACSKRGPAFLSVQAIQARPGIPGYGRP